MRAMFLLGAFLASFLAIYSSAIAEEVTTLEIGAAAPNFKLPGVDDQEYTLKSFADAKLLLVVFTCNHCPTAQAYEDRIIKLHADYEGRGVKLIAISPNDDLAVRLDELGYSDVGDSLADMKVRAKERDFKFPYLYDGETQAASRAFGVVATPQVFLFDAERKLRYVGRIDNSDVKEVTSHDCRNALEALLAGKPVPVEKTRTFGCSTKWAEKRVEAQASIDKWNQEPVTLKNLDEATLAKLVKNEANEYLLINVWASWCGPCVKELPEFVTINRMYRHRKLKLITITLDGEEQRADALKLLQEKHVAAENYFSLINEKDRLADLVDAKWQGPLPHTILIGPGGKLLYRKNGPIDPLAVRRAIVDQLGRTYASRGK
ncbi:thiol-disulfide oxidoreductase [Anatilimnocola aggregata]|uniref:Thiol-disulfide oxidoreductase n=1 Tax=Anatilimnocola aggregata TaxID=2528021 RepID=A0A517YAY2_9BACT|nr:redoxin domain-containing protein [Anatilimnocola aggregata]QDU27405.1 thiol-disulfide oxidoreductase [Anatilimnocola aggregata]